MLIFTHLHYLEVNNLSLDKNVNEGSIKMQNFIWHNHSIGFEKFMESNITLSPQSLQQN
jgi:hypothetical protein